MQTSSFSSNQVSGLWGRNRVGFALLTVVAMLLAVLVPSQGAKAASVTASSVSSVSPATGLSSGSTLVTLTGTNLTGTSTVQFGSSFGTAVTNVSATSVTVRTPAGFGTVDVKITTTAGSVTVKNGFTYKSNTVSTVNSVSPSSGPAAGYNTVTITGTNLRGTSAVSFGTTPAVSFTINSDNQITAVVPAGLANSNVLVNATNVSGLQTTVATYKYSSTVCAPKTYRTTTFKYRSATLTSAQKTAIRAAANELIALGCDQVNLVKYKGSTKGASASYKAYIALSNKRADAVYNVFVKQLNYKGKSIKVNTIKRTTQISQSKKAVYDSYASYRKVLLTVTRTDAIAGIYPSAGSVSGGQPVTITGTGFGAVAATGAIKFGNVLSPSYVINAAGDTIIATVPAGTLGTAPVSIQYGVSGTTSAKLVYGSYTYVNAPTATLITPASGPIAGGSTVTIVGTGFTGVSGANAVQFGGVNAQSYTVTPTSITAVAPANTAGSKTVTITGATGNTASISYDYVAAPTIATITPNVGTINGGTSVTITGSGFTGASASSILFGSANPTNVTVNAAGTQITLTTPARSTGAVNLTIASAGGTVVLTNGYGYGTALTPTFGTPTATATGFTVQVTNYDAEFTWPTLTTTAGTATISNTGLVTVTGLLPGQPSTVTVTTTRTGFTNGTATVTSNASATPTFATPTRTADGYTVVISNYADYVGEYVWANPTVTGGATVSRSGATITVSGISVANTATTVSISVSRTNYLTGTGTVSYTWLGAALNPTFDSAVSDGAVLKFQVSNFNNAYTWNVSATNGSASINGSGLVTVTGLTSAQSTTITVTTTRTGYLNGSQTATGTYTAP